MMMIYVSFILGIVFGLVALAWLVVTDIEKAIKRGYLLWDKKLYRVTPASEEEVKAYKLIKEKIGEK